jgi:endothelin-converting enzyme
MPVRRLTYLVLCYKIFIGLFAGAQHRLSLEHDGKARTTTISATTTSTVTSAITSTVTSSITSTVTSTAIATTTLIPPPVPTKVPEEVCNVLARYT